MSVCQSEKWAKLLQFSIEFLLVFVLHLSPIHENYETYYLSLFISCYCYVSPKEATYSNIQGRKVLTLQGLKTQGRGLLVKKGNKGQISKIHKRFFVSFLLV